MNITTAQLKAQYNRAVKLGWLPFFQEAANTITKGYFDEFDLMGIGSRETNLDPKWLRQLGDGGHAGGLMQADIRSFPDFISSGKWKDARQSILFGARVLMLKWQDYEAHIGMTLSVKGRKYVSKQASGETVQHIVISSYNCGRWSQYCYANGIDLDKYSTGHDYGADVMARASALREWFLTDSTGAVPPLDASSDATSQNKQTSTPAIEQPPSIDTETPTSDTSDTSNVTTPDTPNASIASTTLNKVDAVGDTVQSVQGTVGKFSFPSLPTGLGTRLMTFYKMASGTALMIMGVLYKDRYYIIAALVLAVLAAYLWNSSRNRNNPPGAGVKQVVVKRWWQVWR